MSGTIVVSIKRSTYEGMDALHKLDIRIKVHEGKMQIVDDLEVSVKCP